jgi:hypothetical protein
MTLARCVVVAAMAALCGAGCHVVNDNPDILLLAGTGTSPNDVAAWEAILRSKALGYTKRSSGEFRAHAADDLARHRLLIVPGGNYIEMGRSLDPRTSSMVRDAVRAGLNYLGVCAGGLLAGAVPENGFDLTSGVRFGFYAIVNQGVHKAPVTLSFPDAPPLENYWEDGPEFSGWGDAVARYPDGTPAIVQRRLGKGFVVLAGTHPEAPAHWRHGLAFRSTPGADRAYAAALVDAALNGTALPHF